LGPKCRLCRREGVKLFLKSSRCDSPKCAMARRDYPPGVQSAFRHKESDYGLQLREKQKLKRFYGVMERQFRRYFATAERAKGNTGEHLLQMLERRLDNVVTVAGMGGNRSESRQMVVHGHVEVDGRKIDVPSFQVDAGQVVSIRRSDSSRKLAKKHVDARRGAPMPSWLSLDADNLLVRITGLPTRDDVSIPIQEQLIVELCSK